MTASGAPPTSFDLPFAGRLRRVLAVPAPAGPRPGDGPTWVLLHDGLGSLTQWKDFPEALAAATGRPVLAVERPGHGASKGPPRRLPAALDAEVGELPGLLEALGIGQPLVFGHSDGGTLALRLAADHPDLPRAVLVEAAHVLIEPMTLVGLEATRAAFSPGSRLATGLARHHGEGTEALFEAWNGGWLSPEGRAWTMLDRLSAIRVPTVFLQGDQDPYGSEAQVRAVTDRVQGPVRGVLLPGIGHIPHHEAREAVLAEARALLDRLP